MRTMASPGRRPTSTRRSRRPSADGKPVFLYWGAKWCPPCNQVKATIFNRQDFIERSRHFVPVYVDGDSPNAQRLGSRFKVSGYPTMILFTPDGREITRLPGEVDAEQYMQVLNMGMNGARPIKETLAAALAHGRRRQAAHAPTTGACCRSTRGKPTTRSWSRRTTSRRRLRNWRRRVPPTRRASATRLALKALAAAATAKDAKPRDDKAGAALLRRVLADSAKRPAPTSTSSPTTRATSRATSRCPKSPERAQLLADWDAALSRWIADAERCSRPIG